MDNTKALVAVSGGPDSMAVLDMLRRKQIKIAVGHVNYKKRPSADRDQELVENYCKTYSIPYYIAYYTEESDGNFQKLAREFRYDFFKKLQVQYGYNVLYVGHHKDDDIETYLFQKQRKMLSDTVGLASENELFGFIIRRPLLSMSKDEIFDYCHKNNVPYGIDETNLQTDYTRNRIRKKIAALPKSEYDKIHENLLYEKSKWKKKQQKINKIVKSWDLVIPYATYVKINDVERFLYLRKWLIQHRVKAYQFSESYLKEIDRTIVNKEANYQFGDLYLSVTYDEIALYFKEDYSYKLKRLEELRTNYFYTAKSGLKIESMTLYDDDFPITIRNYKPGDKIEMSYGTKKVSRFFIDRKIPVYKRYLCPVVENKDGKVIFVSGLGSDKRHYSNNPNFFVIEL